TSAPIPSNSGMVTIPAARGAGPSRARRPAVMITVGNDASKGGRAMASKPIVAGTDGSGESLRAVGWAAREAALHGAPLRIVATAGLLPRMSPRAGASGSTYDTVTDVLDKDRDRALATAAERAAKTAAGVLIATAVLPG